MVKRWGGLAVLQTETGEWVEHSDYLLLQAALKEALMAWEFCVEPLKDNPHWKDAMPRIAELRKLLDG
jgi:hypothetical protein